MSECVFWYQVIQDKGPLNGLLYSALIGHSALAELFMVALPYGIGQTIIFLPCGFFFLCFFFPHLISAVADWMSAILAHMVWP